MSNINFPKREEELLDFWEKDKTFEKSVNKFAPKGDFVFYDGPPFATGLPHYGHILASTIKDVIPRYKTMRGYRVRRRWGWDCHGLPIENIVEQQLGISGKKQIAERGVKEFNDACCAGVLRYVNEWGKMVRRIAKWIDFENSYKTMDVSYMDSVWWALKQIWDKGLIYEGRKVLLYCPRCETPISNFEVAMDNSYKDVTEETVIAQFKITSKIVINKWERIKGVSSKVEDTKASTYLLAWTTTPWTLPGNVALAVGENINYVRVLARNKYFIVAEDLLEKVFLNYGIYEKVERIKGKDLVGLEYEPLFDIASARGSKSFKVYSADFVNTEDGTGIVHTAVVYGEDDYNLGLKVGLPIIPLLDEKGVFNKEAPESIRGKYFKEAEASIKEDLSKRELIFKRENMTHSYPHCWRCETPLYYNAIVAWFIDIQKIKKKLLKLNEKISWYPDHLKHGRFKNIVEGAPDWNISRNRYWATPLPIWKSEDGEILFIGSKEELENLSNKKVDDLHKHIIDDIVIEKDGKIFKRIPEVLDCWFESASMPFAEFHYPFENKEEFESRYPADFVAEYIAQTRTWFYYMHAIGVMLFGKPPFKNVVSTGTILNEKGEKLSKSKRNYPEPWAIIDKYGVDALRYYLMTSVVMQSDNLFFAEREVDEAYKKIILLTLNVLSFYKLYDNGQILEKVPNSKNILDKWIIARLHEVIKGMTQGFENYDTVSAGRLLPEFINDLSTWYLRRSRDRFKIGKKSDQKAALYTTQYVLSTLSKLAAPIMPFLAEHVYKELGDKESVHLTEWPKFKKGKIDEDILKDMKVARKVVELTHSARAEAGMKVRQPLQYIMYQGKKLSEELEKLIAEEVNVKEVKHTEKVEEKAERIIKEDKDIKVSLNLEINEALKREGIFRELTRHINDARKEAGLTPSDVVEVFISSDNVLIIDVIREYKKFLKKAVIAKSIKLSESKNVEWGEDVDMKEYGIMNIGIKK